MPTLATGSRSLWSLIVAETLCLLGAEVARFGISVWIYEETRSVGAFSLLLLANLVPGLLAHPIAGSVVDRSSRKAVMIGASLVSLAGTAIVLAGALVGSLSMTLVIIGAALASVADSFQWPALAASVPLMASDAELPKYNGLIESGRAIGRFAGPAIGGLAIAFIGVTGLVAIEAITFVIATAVVAAIAIPRPSGDDEAEAESLWRDMSLGFRWIFAAKPLLKFLLVATFANFFLAICEVVLQPYGLSFLSERSYGIANAMFGAGMIVGGLLSGPLSRRMTNLAQCLLAAVGVGATFIGFGFCRGVIGYAALNLVTASLMTAGNVAAMTIWQIEVPDELQGRVFSAMQMVADLTTPAAFALAAPITESVMPSVFPKLGGATVWGAPPTGVMAALFAVMGVVMIAGFLLAATVGDIRKLSRAPEPDDADHQQA
ncbi:MAG TPA: MFS transporter [Kofleriaceae bacterium]|jgi:MFS family permease